MEQDFVRRGRGPAPTQQELEFLFALMEKGYDAREIEYEYQESSFPPRDQRFIRMQRKYFEAARSVLGNSVGEQPDALFVRRRIHHNEALGELVTRLECAVKNLTRHRFVHDGEFVDWLPYGDGTETKVRKQVRDGHIIEFQLDVESDAMFGCLQAHLGHETWSLFGEWEGMLWQMEQLQLHYEEGSGEWNPDLVEQLSTRHEDIAERLALALAQACHKGVFPGRCEWCP